jgi:hypothetical protein
MEQTSNARVTFSRRRPFPKLHALVLPSSLSTLPPLFLIVAPASFLPSAKKGGNCTDVILGAIIIGGIIIAVQARRTSASIGVMNLLAPSGTRQCQSGEVFSDHHDFGSDPRWLKLYNIISHLSLNVAFLYSSDFRDFSSRSRRDWALMALSSSQLGLEISLIRGFGLDFSERLWSRTWGRRNREHWNQ